jgi:hypothetical protein
MSSVAACGGGDDGGENSTSTDTDQETGSVEAGGGLVTFTLPPGWEVEDIREDVPEQAFLRLEDSWSLNEEQPVVELATVSDGTVTATLGAEPLYEAVDEETWSEALLESFEDAGATVNVQAPGTWAGEPSEQAIGEHDDSYLRLDLAALDGQFLTAQSRAEDVPSESEQEGITELLDSVEVDDSVFGPLQNGLDARIHADAAETGAGDFTASTLVPLDWIHDTEAPIGQVYEDPDTDEIFAQFILVLDDAGLEGEIEQELDEFATDDFFDERPVREEIERDGVPLVVMWDGDPDEATAAAVYGTDGVIFFSLYMVTDDNELLHEMVDALVLIDHN